MSQAGHHQEMTIVGDLIRVLRHPNGSVRGAVVQATLEERLELAIISDRWPAGIREGVRIFAKGWLAHERVEYKRATHYLMARFVEVVPRHRKVS